MSNRFLAIAFFVILTARAVLGQTDTARQDLFVGGAGGYHTYRIPALVVTTKGTVLAFCEGRKTSAEDEGNIDLLLKRSQDSGRNWSACRTPA